MRILRERLAQFVLHPLLIALDQCLQIVGVKFGVERIAVLLFMLVEDFLEILMLDAEHHVGIHGDEAPVAVQGEAPVTGFFRKRRDR